MWIIALIFITIGFVLGWFTCAIVVFGKEADLRKEVLYESLKRDIGSVN